jgi:hypothetical protein
MLFYFFPTWDRRLRLLADWTIWPLVGRDVVWMWRDHGRDYDVRHHVYQAGEVIAERSRATRYVHVLLEGSAELRRGDETVGSVLAGGYVGRKRLEQEDVDTAVATTVVRTLALREDEANRLQDVLSLAGRIVAKTGVFPTVNLPRSETTP